MTKSYNAKDIEILEGLDAVRKRPGMYIGTTGSKGLHHILWEIVDNAIDEAANKFADTVDVTIHADGSCSVADNGRGIPVDMHPKLGISGVEVVFTQLHAGGKFNNKAYSYSGGLHGVGASVTNALSEWLYVEVYKNHRVYKIKFSSKFDMAENKIKGGVPEYPLTQTADKTDKTGTMVRFKPDAFIFETTTFSFDIISKRLKELAFLNKGIKITITDERDANDKGVKRREYLYTGGIIDFVKHLNEAKSVSYDEPIYIKAQKEDIEIELAMQHTDSYTESVFSYVNNIPTTEGGTHETGFKSGITKVLNDYARKINFLKDKDSNFLGEDFREGMTAVLSVKMRNVQFEGQTKTKLGNPEARSAVESAVISEMQSCVDNDANKKVIEIILQKAMAAAKVREAARKAKEITRQKNSIDNAILVGKLSSCSGKKPENNELFIVEGDSAGGSAKQARDRSFQAILPLRGKPLNAERKRLDQVLANEEIRTIISALGTSIGEDFNIDDLKYYKIIVLADADQDGAHIRSILLTFFYRYMKELLTEGNIYVGMPPLYKVFKKDTVKYAYNDDELEKCIEEVGRGYSIQRYKGLGEMNPSQLWETTMDPSRRTLMQVTLEDAAEAEMLVTTLMGDNVEARKAYLSEHANFNKEDTMADKLM